MSYPKWTGTLDIASGMVTDSVTGEKMPYGLWNSNYQAALLQAHFQANAARDITSDLQCLNGFKPWFYDDWFGLYPHRIRPPLVNYSEPAKEGNFWLQSHGGY
jgi:hypothetical protein